MALKFLDSVGLAHVFDKIKALLAEKSDTDHTHNYAGSASVGGAANSANKLNTNAGNAATPVYFENGVPKACTSINLEVNGISESATKDGAGNVITDTYATKQETYSKTEVDAKVAAVVNSAPERLNTLDELAAALGDDENFAATVTNQISLKANAADTYTKAQVDAKIAAVDLSGYLTTTEASSTYAQKTELATALTTAEIDELLA